MRNTRLSTFDARHYLTESENLSIWETVSGKREHETFHYAVLFYSISLVKEAKRPVSVGFRTNYRQVQGQIFIFNSGKAEKTNNNERSSQNNTINQ